MATGKRKSIQLRERINYPIHSIDDCDQLSSFHQAVVKKDEAKVAEFLAAKSSNLNDYTYKGVSALMIASNQRGSNLVSMLCEHVADNYFPMVNLPSQQWHLTALHYALLSPVALHSEEESECIAIINKLVSFGAVVNAETNHEKTPLFYAAKYCNNDKITQLLIDLGANEDEDGIDFMEQSDEPNWKRTQCADDAVVGVAVNQQQV